MSKISVESRKSNPLILSWSKDMSFALETQHGRPLQWGVRIEAMLVITEKGREVTARFLLEEIAVIG